MRCGSAPGCCATSARSTCRCRCSGTARRRTVGRRADHAPAHRPPRGRAGNGPGDGRSRRADGRVQQRGHAVRRHRRDRRPLVAPGLPAPGPRPRRADARPSGRGRRRRRRPHRRHARGRRPSTSTTDPVWDTVDPAIVRVNFDAELRRPSPGRRRHATSARQTSPGSPSAPGCRWWSRGCCAPRTRERCVDAGAAAVWVSNHGGRQLDRALPTAAALPDVAAAVRGSAEVYVDGGLRSGLDVLAALALGADAAFLGRLPLSRSWTGPDGVSRMHAELAEQVSEGLALAGCREPRRRPRRSSIRPGCLSEPVCPGHDDPICTPRQESSNVLRVARERREARPVRSGFRPRGGHLQLTPRQVSERSPSGRTRTLRRDCARGGVTSPSRTRRR